MKPHLLLRDLDLGREFNPLAFPITDALVHAFCQATGEANPLFFDADAARAAGFDRRVAPPGLAGIFGRQAYLRDYAMPPGGVLAGQSIDFHGPAFVGDTLDVRAKVVTRDEQKGRPRVTIQSVARRPGGEEVATVRVVALWPLDPVPEPAATETRGA
jgi:acyl dehydratase